MAAVTDGPVRVGLVGCGRVARMFHLPTLLRLPEAHLVALADADAARAREAHAQAPGAAAHTELAEVLGRDDVDAVIVCLPTGLHAEAAVRAFDAGKHVYVEKPLARDVDEGARIVESWRRSGRVGAMGLNMRLQPLFAEARTRVRSGAIGRVVAVRTSFGAAMRELPAWKTRRATGGGALLDLATHHVDLVRFVLDREVREVSATLRSVRSDEDTAALTLTLEDDTPVQVLASLSAVEEDRFEVYGDEGKLTVDRYRSGRVERTAPRRRFDRRSRARAGVATLRRLPAELRDVVVPPVERSHAASIAAFVAAVRDGGAPAVALTEGLRALEVVEAAHASVAAGRPVALTEVAAGAPA